MDAIKILRQRAADKRDQAIKAARDEHKRASRLIDQIAATIAPEPPVVRHRGPNRPKPIIELIEAVIPRDKPFTVADIMAALKAAEPERDFHVATVRSFIPRLMERGVFRKVCRGLGGHVYYAAPECETTYGPLEALNIVDAARLILEESGPLTSAEIVVTLKERGYRPDDDPRILLRTLRYAFKRNRKRFVRAEDGRWNLPKP